MSCVSLSPAMAEFLDALREWPEVDMKSLRALPEWQQARAWGWVMDGGELTGTGLGHIGMVTGGIVTE